jgi:cell wall-associated NlpC family hydrolase
VFASTTLFVGGFHRLAHLVSTRRLTAVVALGLAVSSATLGLAVGTAAAAPTTTTIPAGTDLATATAQAEQLQLKIAANSKRADILDERFLQARTAVVAAQTKISATQAQISATEASVARLHRQLGGRAALLYMGAGSHDPINIDVSSVQELGAMTKYGAAAAAQDERLLDLLDITDERLNGQRRDLEGQLAVAQDRKHAVDTARSEVEQANASMQHLLATTNASIKLMATQMEQQAAAEAALQEQAWLQHQAELQAARRVGGTTPGTNADPANNADPGNAEIDPGPLFPVTAGAVKAVAYARAQLGKPYVYAGAGPDVFDCSGLTMMAWLQSGVRMEHGSQSQYRSFPHVPIDQLQPGDLVFFGDSGPTNHHVGMVVGPGLMIDAPHTGAFVELVSYFRSDLVPLGSRPQ